MLSNRRGLTYPIFFIKYKKIVVIIIVIGYNISIVNKLIKGCECMIQVKEFESVYGIEDKINKWLCDNKNIEVIDIKYSTDIKEVYGRENIVQSRALVIYKEGEENE